MKKLLLVSAALMLCSAVTFAQCDKDLVLTSSKTDHLDASGALKRSVDENVVVEITKTKVIVTVNGNEEVNGAVKLNTCNWTTPYKEGKTVIKTVVSHDGDDKNATLTVEGKDGKVTLLFELEGDPDDKIRLTPNSFGEKKS